MKSQIRFIRNKLGRILFRTELQGGKLVVKNRHGRLLGFCKNGETRNPRGGLIARGEAPGLLYCLGIKLGDEDLET
jgi:hypothetical protein